MSMEAFECSATAVSWDFAWTGQGNEQIAVECKFADGPMKGQSLTYYGNFSDEMAGEHTRTEWTRIDLMKMGWDGKDWGALVGMGAATFRVKVEPDTYNGKTSMKIKRVFAGGGLAVKNRMSDDERRRFAAKLNGGASKKKTDDDSDIPF